MKTYTFVVDDDGSVNGYPGYDLFVTLHNDRPGAPGVVSEDMNLPQLLATLHDMLDREDREDIDTTLEALLHILARRR